MNPRERNLVNIIIDKPFQFKLLSYCLGFFTISTISLYSTTFLFYWNLKNKGIQVGIPEDHIFYRFLLEQKQNLDMLFIGLAVFNLTLLVIGVLIVSHRIAGPVNKVRAFLKSPHADENYTLRKGDFFQDLPRLINQTKNQDK